MRLSVFVILIIGAAAYRCANCEAEAQTTTEKCPGNQMSRRHSQDALSRFMSVNIPMFYDMVRNGSSMGMNVLSGLVKVERGDEAEKNGLVGNGRRPLSVRILGIPIYERGVRVRPPPDSNFLGSGKGTGAEEEDASTEPLAV